MDRSQIKEGMTVFSADGEKLGKVIRCDADGFLVEKGIFFRKDYLCSYQDVSGFSDGNLKLSRDMSQLQELPRDMWQPLPSRSEAKAKTGTGIEQETRIPVAEEELTAEKRAREAGRVNIHKEVATETKQVQVPVTKEEVSVERVPASGEAPSPGEASFKETDVSVPVYEEEVEIKKKPVIREEVRVSKSAHEEQRAASAETRREEVSVEKEGKIEKLDRDDEDLNRRR